MLFADTCGFSSLVAKLGHDGVEASTCARRAVYVSRCLNPCTQAEGQEVDDDPRVFIYETAVPQLAPFCPYLTLRAA